MNFVEALKVLYTEGQGVVTRTPVRDTTIKLVDLTDSETLLEAVPHLTYEDVIADDWWWSPF